MSGGYESPRGQGRRERVPAVPQAMQREESISLSYPMLNKSNYSAWCIKMEAYMKAQGVWGAVESEEPVETRRDRMALAVIFQGLSDETILRIGSKRSAKDTWNMLRTMHLGATREKEDAMVNQELKKTEKKEKPAVAVSEKPKSMNQKARDRSEEQHGLTLANSVRSQYTEIQPSVAISLPAGSDDCRKETDEDPMQTSSSSVSEQKSEILQQLSGRSVEESCIIVSRDKLYCVFPDREENDKHKPDKVDPNEQRLSKWLNCVLSNEPLAKPCVIDLLGNLFNKEALVNALLTKRLPKQFSYVKGLKDMVNIERTPVTGSDGSSQDTISAQFQCPVSGFELNGKYKFFTLRGCGHVMSAKVLKEEKSSSCLVCHADVKDSDKIVINGTKEEVSLLSKNAGGKRKHMRNTKTVKRTRKKKEEARRRKKKKKKRSHISKKRRGHRRKKFSGSGFFKRSKKKRTKYKTKSEVRIEPKKKKLK